MAKEDLPANGKKIPQILLPTTLGEAGQEIMHPLADLGRRGGNEVTPNARRRSRGQGAASAKPQRKTLPEMGPYNTTVQGM